MSFNPAIYVCQLFDKQTTLSQELRRPQFKFMRRLSFISQSSSWCFHVPMGTSSYAEKRKRKYLAGLQHDIGKHDDRLKALLREYKSEMDPCLGEIYCAETAATDDLVSYIRPPQYSASNWRQQ